MDTREGTTHQKIMSRLGSEPPKKFTIFLDIDETICAGYNSIRTQKTAHLYEKKVNQNYQEQSSYSGYVPNSMLHQYAEFQALIHFFDELSLSNLTSIIEHIKKKSIEVNIVIISDWKVFLDTDVLKILFCKLPFSQYIVDKIFDKACFYVNETEKCDLILMDCENDKESSSNELYSAQTKMTPVLIKEKNGQFSMYSYLASDWVMFKLKHLSNDEQKILNELNFNEKIIKSDQLSNPLYAIIKKYYNPNYATRLNRAESIELYLKQKPIEQFIILDNDDCGLSKLFPKNFVHCKKLLGAEEYQLALRTVDDLLTQPEIIPPQQVQNKLIPFVKNTLDECTSCIERLPETSMRVLESTRRKFLESILRMNRKSPFKDDTKVTNLVLEYEEDFQQSCPRNGK